MPAPLRIGLSLVAALSLLVALPQDGFAKKKRHHRRAGCSKFCRQAGGFGAGPEKVKMPVKIPRQTITPDDGMFGVRATCTLEHKCVGAIIVSGRKVEYGRADLRIPEGETRIVLVRLSSAGRRFLKRVHHDHQVFAAVSLIGNHPASISKRLTLLRNDR